MGCRWAPDGTCVLTATLSDGKFRLYDTPFHRLGSKTHDSDIVCSSSADDKCSGSEMGAEDTASSVRDGPQSLHESATETSCHSHNENAATLELAKSNSSSHNNSLHSWEASLTSHQGGPPPPSSSSSYTFYPHFNSSSPPTALYATCRGHSLPIHLIDAYTSSLRASYRPHNNVDELEGPTIVEFSPDGSKIYGTGFKTDRTIAVFDTSIPGREGQILRLGKTRRSADGQKGIPSALAFPNNNCSGGGGGGNNGPSNVFAVGAYSPASIYIYDDRMASSPAGTIVLHGGLTVVGHGKAFSRKKRRFATTTDESNNDDGQEEKNWFSSARVHWFQSQARGGVTQLMWAPCTSSNPYVLYSASRRSNAVLSWDVRMLSCNNNNRKTYPICGLKSYARDGDTNQRLGFDLDRDGKKIFVGTGCKEGTVKIYDTASSTLEYELEIDNSQCKDAVNGVSVLHTGSESLLAVATGSRSYPDEDVEGDTPSLSSGLLQLYSISDGD
eukprot:scaffold12152_cov52-Cyclotella_meneghiniana.AAC.4